MHAEEGKTCSETGCAFFDREVKTPARSGAAVKVVRRKPKETKPAEAKPVGTAAKGAAQVQPRRATKKSKLKKPRKWGGRSGTTC